MALETTSELQAAVMLVLSGHVGRDRRISRPALLQQVRERIGYRVSDRRMRAAIEALCGEQGICSSSSDGGYWLPARLEEYDQAIAECRSRIAALNERANALAQARARHAAQPLEQGQLL